MLAKVRVCLGSDSMATMKRIEKRMNDVEKWMKRFEEGQGPAKTMDNMNFLVGQTRQLGERLQQAESHINELRGALDGNNQILQQFLEKNEMVPDWKIMMEEIKKEADENAVQEQETESVDAREQTGDGEEVGEGDA